MPPRFERIVQSWDTANKASELNPHPNPPPHAGEGMVGVHELGRAGQDLYVIDVLRRRMEYSDLKRAVRYFWF